MDYKCFLPIVNYVYQYEAWVTTNHFRCRNKNHSLSLICTLYTPTLTVPKKALGQPTPVNYQYCTQNKGVNIFTRQQADRRKKASAGHRADGSI